MDGWMSEWIGPPMEEQRPLSRTHLDLGAQPLRRPRRRRGGVDAGAGLLLRLLPAHGIKVVGEG